MENGNEFLKNGRSGEQKKGKNAHFFSCNSPAHLQRYLFANDPYFNKCVSVKGIPSLVTYGTFEMTIHEIFEAKIF